MSVIRRLALKSANRCLDPWGHRIVSVARQRHYLDLQATLRAAQASGQTVSEYVETIWGQRGCTAAIIQEMTSAGACASLETVVEIGPGTGRYLECVLRDARPDRYEIYELDEDWAEWLVGSYGPTVVQQAVDGRSLQHTLTRSCGLVHAHGVFVYLSILNAFEYFAEMCRVCAPGGHVVFDFYPAASFDEATIAAWLRSDWRYPVVLPAEHVFDYFVRRGFEIVREFDAKHGEGHSHYVVFKRGTDH